MYKAPRLPMSEGAVDTDAVLALARENNIITVPAFVHLGFEFIHNTFYYWTYVTPSGKATKKCVFLDCDTSNEEDLVFLLLSKAQYDAGNVHFQEVPDRGIVGGRTPSEKVEFVNFITIKQATDNVETLEAYLHYVEEDNQYFITVFPDGKRKTCAIAFYDDESLKKQNRFAEYSLAALYYNDLSLLHDASALLEPRPKDSGSAISVLGSTGVRFSRVAGRSVLPGTTTGEKVNTGTGSSSTSRSSSVPVKAGSGSNADADARSRSSTYGHRESATHRHGSGTQRHRASTHHSHGASTHGHSGSTHHGHSGSTHRGRTGSSHGHRSSVDDTSSVTSVAGTHDSIHHADDGHDTAPAPALAPVPSSTLPASGGRRRRRYSNSAW